MLKKQCEECGFEYEYEGFANLMVFCPCCNEFDYLSCEYGFGPVVPCRIFHGKMWFLFPLPGWKGRPSF